MRLWLEFWDRLLQDLRYGTRFFLTKPGFSAVALLSVALAVGATTAIFSVIYAVLIDPYPYRAADRLGSLALTGRRTQLPVLATDIPRTARNSWTEGSA